MAQSMATAGATKAKRLPIVKHGIFKVSDKFAPLLGSNISSATISPDTDTIWIVDDACAQQLAGPCIDGDDIENIPFAQTVCRAEKTLAPVPTQGPFTQLTYMPRQKLFIGWSIGEKRLSVFDIEMQLIAVVDAPTPIYSAIVNEQTLELMTGGVGEVLVWVWRPRHALLEVRVAIAKPSKGMVPAFATKPVLALQTDDIDTVHQRVFVGTMQTVLVYDMRGVLLSTMSQIHSRPISAMLHHVHTGLLLTASRDGTIKLWDPLGQLKHVFVGHTREVTTMIMHPYDSLVMSSSLDRTVRVWNLKTLDTVLTVTTDEPLEQIGRLTHKLRMYSVSKAGVEFWQINTVHCDFAEIGTNVTLLQRIEPTTTPARILAMTETGTVHLLSPVTGASITSTVPQATVTCAVFSSCLDRLYCCTAAGAICVLDCGTNPCDPLTPLFVPTEKTGASFNCLAIIELKDAEDRYTPHLPGLKGTGEMVLAAGTPTGDVYFFNGKTGAILNKAPKIHTGKVSHLLVNTDNDRMVSLADDKMVQVWAIKGIRTGEVEQIRTFYLPLIPKHAVYINSDGRDVYGEDIEKSYQLCVVMEEPNSGRFPVNVYCTETKRCKKHAPQDDHDGIVSDVTGCAKMMWFATAALDGRVKLWSEQNLLVRELDLYHPIMSCTFMNHRGSLVVGVQGHVHWVNCEDFLPQKYQRRYTMITAHVADDTPEAAILSHMKSLMSFVSPTAGATARALEERESQLREAAAQRRLKQEDEAAQQRQGHGEIRNRDDEIEFLMQKRLQSRFEDPKMEGKVKRNLKMSKYMLHLYPMLEDSLHLHAQYKEPTKKQKANRLMEFTMKELEKLEEGALNLPEAQYGEAQSLYYQSIAVNCPPSDYLAPPLAPDGYIPNSVIWQQMREYGGEPGVGGVPDWTPQGMTDEQRRAQEVESESESEDGDGMFMGDALADVESEEEEVEEEEVEEVKRAPGRRNKSSMVMPEKPKPQTKFKKKKPKTPEPTPPPTPTPPRTPTPEPPVIEKPKTPEPVVIRWPPLPRYISMFRDVPWFELKFPRAVPKKFDFLRIGLPDETGMHPQVTLSTWIEYLCSLDYEPTAGFGGLEGVGNVRKGLIWKARDALIGSLKVDAIGLARDVTLTATEQELLEIFDGVLLGINKMAAHNEIRPLMGIDDIRTISRAILEILKENRLAAQAAKQKADRNKEARDRGAGADFKAAFDGKKAANTTRGFTNGDGSDGVHRFTNGLPCDGSMGDDDDGRGSMTAFPGGGGVVGADHDGDPDAGGGGGGGWGGGGGGGVDIFAVAVGAMNVLPELQCDELADADRVKRQSMQCVEILTSLKQKGKVFVQEILALETGGDVDEQALARRSLATLGLHDRTGLIALETQRLFGDQLQKMSGEQKRRESLTFAGTFLEARNDEYAAKMWKNAMKKIASGGKQPMSPFSNPHSTTDTITEEDEKDYIEPLNEWVRDKLALSAVVKVNVAEETVETAKLERIVLPRISSGTVPRIGYMRFKPGTDLPIPDPHSKFPPRQLGGGSSSMRSGPLQPRLELRPKFHMPTPYFEQVTDIRKDQKPFSLLNTGRYFSQQKSWLPE